MQKFSLLLLALVAACSSGRSASESPKDVETKPQRSSLPSPPANPGEAYCPAVAESDWRGYEPSLSAWLRVSDSIFVGTIASVEHVVSPVYLQESPSTYTLLPGGAADCPQGVDDVTGAIRVNFKEVDVLYGVEVPDEFSIQMSLLFSPDYPGITFWDGDAHPRDLKGDETYLPGARIGAALFFDKNGGFHWRYRQFEVLNGNVHLQQIDEEALRACWAEPQVIGIPDSYEGVSLDAFKTAIANAGTQLSSDELAAATARHLDFEGDLQRDSYLVAQNPTCGPGDLPPPDQEGDRDPRHNP